MRTTLTLDDDIVARLKAESRRSGRPFRDVVNEMLRRGLAGGESIVPRPPFTITPSDLGELRSGLSLDKIAEVIERAEGSLHR